MECKNCQVIFEDDKNYCHDCGAKVIRNRLTFRNLFDDFKETYLNIDNQFLKTFIQLFYRPEDVIDSYINGVRKKHVGVISYFALAITFAGLYVFIQKKFFPAALDYSMLVQKGQEEMQKNWMIFIMDYMSILTLLYVPAYALIGRVTFAGLKKYNYTELLVVFMYIQAQLSIISAVITVMLMTFGWHMDVSSLILTPLMIFYSGYCLKRLYRLNMAQMALRTFIFFIILGFLWIFMGLILVIIWYFTGDLQTMIEAQRTVKGS